MKARDGFILFISAFSAVIACINKMGPGLGQVGPSSNHAGLTNDELSVLSFTMLLGRKRSDPPLEDVKTDGLRYGEVTSSTMPAHGCWPEATRRGDAPLAR
ncbi:hypothetical protein [uncultured Thiodictyon sp.]|uniref:hypothetical protein n=1 Tax=uncultured Thiodictyon sp. TaxID=1846217 RepID=UPI0025E9DB3E|nr:hypothetical protein [uncultured Thiodictyon sp.]